MYKISLNNLEFYSFHGVYQEENLIGGNFLVDMFVEVDDQHFRKEELETTINYVDLLSIVRDEMNQPKKLLETVVKNIAERSFLLSESILKVEVEMTKKKVPVDGMTGEAKVCYSHKK